MSSLFERPASVGENVKRLWLITIAISLVFLAARVCFVCGSGVPIPWAPATSLMGMLSLVCLLLGTYYLWVRGEAALATPLLGLGMVLAGSIATGEATDLPFYMGRSEPFVDAALAAADDRLGFCWRCYAALLDKHPWLYETGDAAYRTILGQAPLTVVVLSLSGQRVRLCIFLVTCNVAIVLTSIVAYRFPALGPYTFYGLNAADHPNITMLFSDNMRGTIAWLREGVFSAPSEGLATGLISFPSFHAAMAAAYVWAAWPTVYRWPALALNAAMLAVTPIDGSHYLTDVLAGLGIGACSIAVSSRCLMQVLCCHRPAPTPIHRAGEQWRSGDRQSAA